MEREAAYGNPRMVPIAVATEFGRDDVIWGVIEGWNGSRARVVVRDVALFSDEITYGDEIDAIEADGGMRYERTIAASGWNAFVAESPDDDAMREAMRRISGYEADSMIAAKAVPGRDGPIIAVAVAAHRAQDLADDLDEMTTEGLLSGATWSIFR